MNQSIDQAEINAILWRACDTLRGTVDPSEFKNNLVADAESIERVRLLTPSGTLFTDLYRQHDTERKLGGRGRMH